MPPKYFARNGCWLDKWISTQRLERQKGTLTAEQIRKLDEIGIRWQPMDEYKWDIHYEMAKRYPKNEEGLPIIPKDDISSLGAESAIWFNTRQKRYKAGKMKESQVKRWEGLTLPEAPVRKPARRMTESSLSNQARI